MIPLIVVLCNKVFNVFGQDFSAAHQIVCKECMQIPLVAIVQRAGSWERTFGRDAIWAGKTVNARPNSVEKGSDLAGALRCR